MLSAHTFVEVILMYYVKHAKRERKKGRLKKIFAVTAGLLLFLVIFISIELKPLILRGVEYRSRQVFTQTVNDSVNEIMLENGITSSDLVTITYNAEGEIISVTPNSPVISALSAKISAKIQEKMLAADEGSVTVPLGNLTGLSLLAGRGPDIGLKLEPNGSVLSRLSSSLAPAGINQTLYSVNCEVSAKMYVSLPWFSQTVEMNTKIQLVETVIVGRIPDTYANIESPDTADATQEFVGNIWG
jgi:sporulation protein YunB